MSVMDGRHLRRLHRVEVVGPSSVLNPLNERPSSGAASVEHAGYELVRWINDGSWSDYNALIKAGNSYYLAAIY